MKYSSKQKISRRLARFALAPATINHKLSSAVLALGVLVLGGTARASIAYGSLNNFDCVNDTGVRAHGFEIELEDIRSTDIGSCYSWNHYGTPKISETNVFKSGAWHTNVFVRYAANWTNNSGWSAYTAVPAGPIPPTQGHQFTNPGTAVKYNWLIDNGAHVLVHGPPVNVATPTFTYIPPAAAVPAKVQAAIVPPPPPVPDPKEFGTASWVKEIRTTTHNSNPVKLRDLVSDDPDDPNEKNWRNGEPDEVEVEWQLLQVDHNAGDGGANGELVGAPEDLPGGDEVITRRYEFYKYVGPFDTETGEAMADKVGPDGIHGVGIKTINGLEMDLSTNVIVGEYYGSQMAAYDVDSPIGLIDHLQDGEVDAEYPARTIVISGTTNFVATTSGDLPDGMTFDPTNAMVSGTPTASGVFAFQVQVTASNSPALTRKYLLTIAPAGEVLPPHSSVDTSASPANGGTTSGDGVYTNGTTAAVTATPAAGFAFVNWTDNGELASTSASYTFTNLVNRSLVANFVALPQLSFSAPQANTLVLAWPTNFSGFVLQQNSDPATANWADATNAVSIVGSNRQVTIAPLNSSAFFRLRRP